MRKPTRRTERPGLTLIELLVVLTILAVMTVVAVSLTDSVIDQGRYDVTKRTLNGLNDAVLGDPGLTDADGSRLLSGFRADVGRLPLAVGSDPATQLAELWSNPRGLPPYGPHAAADPEVVLFGGWRGPYLRLGSQTTGQPVLLRDGWGQPFELLGVDLATPVAADQPVAMVRSKGGKEPPYDTGLTLASWAVPAPTTLAGSVQDSDTTTPQDKAAHPLTVRAFYYDGTVGAVNSSPVELTAAELQEGKNTFSFVLPPGHVALRAYQSDGSVVRKSAVVYLRLPAGGLNRSISFDVK